MSFPCAHCGNPVTYPDRDDIVGQPICGPCANYDDVMNAINQPYAPTQSDAQLTAWLRTLEPGKVQLDRLPTSPIEIVMLQHTVGAA